MTIYDILGTIITKIKSYHLSIHFNSTWRLIIKKILIVALLMLLLPLFGCLQPHVKSVDHLQSDYDRLQSLKISLENDLLHAPDPLEVKNHLREVELRMRYIEIEILKKQVEEN